MEHTNPEEYTQRSFYSLCKRVLKNNAIDLQREAQRRGKREVAFSALSAQEQAALSATDAYFTDAHIFNVLGERIGVSDIDLAEALGTLPADRRDIVLLSYFFDMTDKEIAQSLNLARRTVAYRRTATLQALKKLMESEE